MEQPKKHRILIVAVLALCLVAVAGFGTLAWLTATDSATNAFTTGNFNTPDKDPDPDNPVIPGDKDNVDGFLTETEWEDNSKIIPGVAIPKNPNVGVGADSDDSYVFVYVENNTLTDPSGNKTSAPQFTIDADKWEYVGDNLAVDQVSDNTYVSGLFAYKGTGDHIFTANDSADVYTGELFETVMAPNGVDMGLYADAPTIEVTAYLYSVDHEATDSAEGTYEAGLAWAKTQIRE